MKIVGQDKDGRIVIDGEGEEVHIRKGIPADSPAFLTNFTFINDPGTPIVLSRFPTNTQGGRLK